MRNVIYLLFLFYCDERQEKKATSQVLEIQMFGVFRVQVSVIESLGIHIVFSDYQHGDAPVLLVNYLRNRSIVYYQQEDP